MKKYIVRLSDEERETCDEVVNRLSGRSQKARRARILRQVDVGGPGWSDKQVAEAYRCTVRTIENVRKRCLLEGFQEALQGKQRGPGTVRKVLDGRQEAELIAMRLSEPPKGFGSWSLRLLAKQAVELEIVDSISHETVGRTLKRNGISGRKLQYWVIPPKANGEYAAAMEEVLHTYERPGDEKCPVICMDEQPIQLIKETRLPLPETREHPQRVDYEYKRAGTASVFMFCEPLAGWRSAHARDRRTKLDWAQEVAHLLEGRYADCEKVTLVLDNLNTHTKGALYEAFEPERARRLAVEIQIRRTGICQIL